MTAGVQVVKVNRKKVSSCMTCSICNSLFKEATTISLCLHTFCRKCIYEKLSDDEEMDYCPVCNIHLGCIPVEKLRPDHSMQDIVSKIFYQEKITVKPIKRKERSLSSLVVSTPKVSVQISMAGRRTKTSKRQGGSQFYDEEPREKEEHVGDSSSSDAINKFPNKRRAKETTTTPERSNNEVHVGAGERENEPWGRKAELWTPLNCLLEAATGTKPSNFDDQNVPGSNPWPDKLDEGESYTVVNNGRENGRIMSVEELHDQSRILLAGEVRSRRLHAMKKKRSVAAAKLVSPQAVLNAMREKHDRRNTPIWFSLVASDDQEDCAPLPQIPVNYLRVKDGNLHVAFIQKYLSKKLNLANESEVVVMCNGQPMQPSARLHDLVDIWVKATSRTNRVSTTRVGASAQEYVMILSYARSSSQPG